MSFDSGRLSHSYITDSAFADSIATAVVCDARGSVRPCLKCTHCDKAARHIHPDIIEIGRLDNKTIIGIDQIRELKKDVYIVPNDAMQKAYLVRDADAMNINAQNAFLQILEEPPAHAVFILSTSNPAALLPTVRSRCVLLRSQNLDDSVYDNDNAEHETIKNIADDFLDALSGDNLKLMECMFAIDKLDKLSFYDFLTLARNNVALLLRENTDTGNQNSRKALVHAETVLSKAGEMLDLNVSAGHIAGFICAEILK